LGASEVFRGCFLTTEDTESTEIKGPEARQRFCAEARLESVIQYQLTRAEVIRRQWARYMRKRRVVIAIVCWIVFGASMLILLPQPVGYVGIPLLVLGLMAPFNIWRALSRSINADSLWTEKMTLMNWRDSASNRNSFARLFVALGGVILIGLSACQIGTTRPARLSDVDSVSKLNALHYDYLTNNAEGAKLDMLNAIKVLDSSTNRLRAHDGYWFGYGRLFFIESMAGDSNLASIYFEKARYWYLIHQEDMTRSPSAIARDLDAFSKEQCKALMLEWDRQITGGRGPRFYLDSIAQQGPAPGEQRDP
jgi:hypothetical protein